MNEDTGRTPRAFILGVDIEEVYIIFGESLQLALGGLSPSHYDQIEEKAHRVRGALLGFGCPGELVQRFEMAVSKIYRTGNPPAGDRVRLRDEGLQTGNALSDLMFEVRGHLGADDTAFYDLGIMLARLHLCLRILVTDQGSRPSPELRNLYVTELQRGVPRAREFLAAAEQTVCRAALEQFSARLRSLTGEIEAWDGGSEQWCGATLKRLDRVFAASGALPRKPSVNPSAPVGERLEPNDASVDARVRALQEAFEHANQLFSARDLVAAEQAYRTLIEECRSTIGFTHPFTLSARTYLCLTLLGMERGDLAADVALDLADDAEESIGQREPGTARIHVQTLFVLMATRGFEECLEFLQSRLGWLHGADPETLSPELAEIQQELFQVVRG